MTGFGRGSAGGPLGQWEVECAAVNRKQLEVVVSLPRDIQSPELEAALRQLAQERAARGRIQVIARLQKTPGATAATRVDRDAAAALAREIRETAAALGLVGDLSPGELARLPGVLVTSETAAEFQDADRIALLEAAAAALDSMTAMRATEGRHLAADLAARLDGLESRLAAIDTLAPAVPVRQRESLRQRLADAGLDVPLDDERLLKEVALFADRCDISEELTRARSHLAQFRATLAGSEPAGRPLDFLTQELFREFNTMGSKASDAGITREVVAAKTDLEKIREQVQNLE